MVLTGSQTPIFLKITSECADEYCAVVTDENYEIEIEYIG